MKQGEKLLRKFPKKHSIASLDSMGAGMLARIDGQMSSDFAILDPMGGWFEDDQKRIVLAANDNAENSEFGNA